MDIILAIKIAFNAQQIVKLAKVQILNALLVLLGNTYKILSV